MREAFVPYEAFSVEPVGLNARSSLDHVVRTLIAAPDLDSLVAGNQDFANVMGQVRRTLESAFQRHDVRALTEAHRTLYFLYEQAFAAPIDPEAANQFHPFLLRVRNDIERAWERCEIARARIDRAAIPADPAAFSTFFRDFCAGHRLAHHPLFDFLERRATRDEIVSFFLHDRALILRFCDLVSLAMIGADDEVRGELAVNLWDEMGNGDAALRHTVLFQRLMDYVGIDADAAAPSAAARVDMHEWQGFAGYNLHLFFSLHRRNYFRSVGCLGSSEFMDSAQYAKILRGCHRVGLEDMDRLAYYASHVEIDVAHGDAWLANVLVPLVLKYPEARYEIVLGAAMRLNVTADYFDAVLRKLSRPRREPASQAVHQVERVAATVAL